MSSDNYKRSVASENGEVEATIECSKNDDISVVRLLARFKGKTGILTFRTKNDETSVSFDTDDFSISCLDSNISASRECTMKGERTMVAAEKELFLSGGQKTTVQAAQGGLNLFSNKDTRMGALQNIDIRSMKKIKIKSDISMILESPKIQLDCAELIIGKYANYAVALVFDNVSTSSGSGTITGPGSTIIKVSK